MLQALGFVTSSRLCYWARGPWGPLGPRCRIRVATVTTYCQAGFQPYETCTQQPHTCTQTFPHTDYLLSGKATYCQAKLPTVRQSYLLSGKATYCQASYLLSGMHPNVAAYFAPNNRILVQVTFFREKGKQHVHILSNVTCFKK